MNDSRRSLTCVVLCVFAWLLVSPTLHADDGVAFFERQIRPLLAKRCYECHGPEQQENELRLDRPADLLTGGVSGKPFLPGKPDGSLLIAAVRYVNEDLQMPPEKQLPDDEIALLIRWVEMGAPLPGGNAVTADAQQTKDWQARVEHWAFQPPQRPSLPKVQNEHWVKTPVDRFILARLEDRQISPVSPADRRTLIRRATYDLIGLPPTPQEIEAFLNDDSSQAFEKVIDRLLASPHYGQRWGRHWLDVARYSDSNGLDENVAHGNAWRYRDWVIESFNNDKPYDAFIREQIAGDLLPADEPQQRNAHLIATGFLSLGPKVLAEVDEQKMEMDIIDEQIDTLGRSMLGLTLGCARCHDHKFDPLTQRDYYALGGIFKSTHTMDSFMKIAKWHENELFDAVYEKKKAEHERQLATRRKQLDEAIATATEKLQQELGQGAALPAKPEESFSEQTQAALKKLRDEIAAIEKNPPTPATAMGVREGSPVDVSVHVRGSHLTLGETSPRSIPAVFTSQKNPFEVASGSGRLELANWLASSENPLTARVMVNRVWRWHFGRGLVETTDNFGLLGAKPSHPELLDYLAIDFARDWSLKRLHRQIMLSSVYQSSSKSTPELAKQDPENRLLGRMSIRRLEAEAIRDGLLAVSGALDKSAGGPVIHVKNREFIFNHTSKDETSYTNYRRSVYLPVVRNHLYEAFTLFDYADASVPNGNRNTSTVASQALYLLNSELVIELSQRLARQLSKSDDGDRQRVKRLYELAYGRPASESEIERATSFIQQVKQQATTEQAWQLLCHNVMISNEFFYVQ